MPVGPFEATERSAAPVADVVESQLAAVPARRSVVPAAPTATRKVPWSVISARSTLVFEDSGDQFKPPSELRTMRPPSPTATKRLDANATPFSAGESPVERTVKLTPPLLR